MHVQPLVGDLTGDGIPEIVVWSNETGSVWPTGGGAECVDGVSLTVSPRVRTMLVYDGKDMELPIRRFALSNDISSNGIYMAAYGATPYGLVKVGDRRLIIVACSDYKLRAYDIMNGDPTNQYCVWTSTETYSNLTGETGNERRDVDATVGFADFNHDGTPEVYVRNCIFNAATGARLAVASGGTNTGSSHAYLSDAAYLATDRKLSAPIAADVIPGGNLELILGNEVYDVTVSGGGAWTLAKNAAASVTPPGGATIDGHAQVADFNNDGTLDVLVTVRQNKSGSSSNIYMYIYTPSTGTTGPLTTIPVTTTLPMTSFGKGFPLISDVDNDGKLEVVIMAGVSTTDIMKIYECNPATFELTADGVINGGGDDCYSLTPVSFDFYQNGVQQIVFLGRPGLTAYNGVTKAATPSLSYSVMLYTVMQAPVIADVDDDGEAEIVIVAGASSNLGRLMVLKSNRFAPARKVWNQFMYHSVNVNNDLSIPQNMFNPASTLGSLRPFNNFFMQQTTINSSGTPVWPMADARHVPGGASFSYDPGIDMMKVTIKVKNEGYFRFNAPFMATAYKGSIGNAIKQTASYSSDLRPQSTVEITINIPNYRVQWAGANIAIRLNDSGNGLNNEPACQSPGRDIVLNGALIALDDRLLVFTNSSTTNVRVTANDIKSCPSVGSSAFSIDFAPDGNPKHGIATKQDTIISYTPNPGYIGLDTIVYTITCSGQIATGRVYINVTPRPDNIIAANCYSLPPPQKWSIREVPTASVEHSNAQSVLVGDMDGDGQPEVLVMNFSGNSEKIHILNGSDLSEKKSFNVPPVWQAMGPLAAIGRVKWSDGKDTTIIVFLNGGANIKKLNIYNTNGNLMKTSDEQYTTLELNDYRAGSSAVSLADLDGDGYTEIIAGNRVFAAETGKLLCKVDGVGGVIHGWYSAINMEQTAVADVLGLGNQQICVGNRIYGVTLNNRNGTAGNDMRLLASITPVMHNGATPPSYPYGYDGCTQVVDFDLDGYPDVVVSTVSRVSINGATSFNNKLFVYVWSPHKKEIIASKVLDYVYKRGVPFVGNINSSPYPEIVFVHGDGWLETVSNSKITAFEYDPQSATKELSLFWQLDHSDPVSGTGLTLFDFNQDGISELVYRDMTDLRIINGSKISHNTGNDTIPYNLASFPCRSLPAFEYCTVADIDNDGSAEIIASDGDLRKLRVFKSGVDTKWAPARKVWNQYGYNSANVNDDLTIPRYPIQPATVFPGADGILGTSDDLRPFNNFLQQQTTIGHSGQPVWALPDAQVVSGVYDYVTASDNVTVDLDIFNVGDVPISAPLYVSAYAKSGSTESLLQTVTINSPGAPIFPGQTTHLHFVVNNISSLMTTPGDSLIIYVNHKDGSYVQQECEFGNNRTGESFARLKKLTSDTRTVQKHSSVDVDVFGSLPSYIYAGPFSPIDSVVLQPRNGKLVGVGSGSSSKLIYINEGTDNLSINPIDSFQYRIRLAGSTSAALSTVYIYILQDENGGSACAGQAYTAKMKAVPAGVTFDWYASLPDGALAQNTVSYTIPGASLSNDWSCWIKPKNAGGANEPWNLVGGFPFGQFTIHASQSGERMRWTGHINSDWHNPGNWVLIRSAGESPASFLPGLCSDVTISSNVNNFPELGTDTARCRRIAILDRAMLKNPHVLKYTTASVEIKLKPSERDRFVMWSAPLKDMYTGDYHYRIGNSPFFGDSFMNFFQISNPDAGHGSAVPNRFTATFSNPNIELPLGKAFNLKVATTGVTRDSLLRFPRTETGYANPPAPTPTLSRANAGRFIVDGYNPNTFQMPVAGGTLNSTLVQVVNPYIAYLDVVTFLAGNANLQSGYYIWDGEVGNDVQAHAFATTTGGDQNNRIVANIGVSRITNPGYIAPLQSFFVAKSNPATSITTLNMSRNWTTTKPVDSYYLRSSIASGGVLNVILSGANKEAHAALVYEPGASNFSTDKLDMPAVTYAIDGATPLSVYSVSADLTSLAINASSTFDMLPVTLGLVAQDPGEYSLSFEGLASCGYDVALQDVELDKRVELSPAAAEYKFTLIKTNASGAIEVNSRFKLYFKYTGNGVTQTEAPKPDPLKVSSEKGYINVSSDNLPISTLRVYDAHGRTVYHATTPTGTLRIPVASGLYIVKATFGSAESVEKITVK